NAMTSKRICEPVKRRLKDAGLPSRLSPRFFRVTAITDLLTQGVPLEDVQYLAGHAEPRTTGLYDRRQKKVTRNIVERISVKKIGMIVVRLLGAYSRKSLCRIM